MPTNDEYESLLTELVRVAPSSAEVRKALGHSDCGGPVIPLRGGGFALVDDVDAQYVRQWGWRVAKGYARRVGDRTGLHKVVWTRYAEIPDGFEIDHINGDKLDNRRRNLRLATPQQQKCNVRKRRLNTSGITGVRWAKSVQRWVAEIQCHGDKRSARFHDVREAVDWRNAQGKLLHGEFFVPSVIPPNFKGPGIPGEQLKLWPNGFPDDGG